jgi:hypothetical protein
MKTKEYIDDITEQEVWSDCCSAKVIIGDICSACFEHCEAVPYGEDYMDNDDAWSGGFADNH